MVFPGSEALVRAQLAQRLDLLLRHYGVAGVQSARPVGGVQAEAGQPSRAGVERQVHAGGQASPTRDARAKVAGTGREPAPPAPVPSPGPTTSVASHLSATARTLAALLHVPTSDDPATPPGQQPVRGAAPLAAAPAAVSAPALAQALAQVVGGSGLFYESHLEQLAQGARPLAQVQSEPQALLARAPQPQTADRPQAGLPAPAAPAADAARPAHARASMSPAPAATPLADAVARAGAAGPANHAAAGAGNGGHAAATATAASAATAVAPMVHPATVEIVQQQLELLAGGVFRWSGEAWPGVPLEWELREDREASQPDAPQRAWITRVQVVSPTLGPVDATLRLDGEGGLQVRLAAEEEGAAQALATARTSLLRRLSAGGFRVQACDVEGA